MLTDKLILVPKKKVSIDLIERYKDLIDIICGKGDDINTNKYYFQKTKNVLLTGKTIWQVALDGQQRRCGIFTQCKIATGVG